MEKILIFTGNYYPKPSANGICTHQIALALTQLGYEVHIICYKKNLEKELEEINGINVHRIEMGMVSNMRETSQRLIDEGFRRGIFIKKIAILLNRIKIVLYWPLYPMTSPVQAVRMYRTAKILHKDLHFKSVISVFNPIDSLVAGMLMKKKYKEIKFFPYFLDSITASWGHEFISKTQLQKKGWKWEERVFRTADKIIAMKYHESHHRDNRYSQFRDKTKYLDIPLFRPINIDDKDNISPFEQGYVDLTYTGRLEMNNYDPWYAITLLRKITTEHYNLRVHFYSRGSCEDKLNEMMKSTSGFVVRHGFVEAQEAIRAIMFTDILISFGTAESNMIPSKIFEYMSTGKPIIHFYKQNEDVCLPYFKKYPLSLVIKESTEDKDQNIKRIQKFIQDVNGKKL